MHTLAITTKVLGSVGLCVALVAAAGWMDSEEPLHLLLCSGEKKRNVGAGSENRLLRSKTTRMNSITE